MTPSKPLPWLRVSSWHLPHLPHYPFRSHQPQIERKDAMSLCVAAIAHNLGSTIGQRIVVCSDTRLSYAHSGSNEQGIKLVPIGFGWVVQLAGDPGAARDAISRIAAAMRAITDYKRLSQVLDAIQIGVDEYKDSPLYRPDAIELLFSGFIGDQAILLHLDSSLQLRDPSHHCAIGEGAIAATLMMNFRGSAVGSTTDRTVYCVYEAKRFAESINSIGQRTFMLVQGPVSGPDVSNRVSCAIVNEAGQEKLNRFYQAFGSHPIGDVELGIDDITLPPSLRAQAARLARKSPKRGRRRLPPSRA